MKAVVVETFGEPSKALKVKDIPIPFSNKPLESSQVRIQVKAAAINPVDAKISRGLLALLLRKVRPPYVPGFDFAGIVEEVGSQVRLFSKGDAVFGRACLTQGSFAEYCIAEENDIHKMPTNISFEQACGFPVVGLTAYCGLVKYGKIHRGERVLIVGGSGGVGSQAVPMAKLLGASFVGAVCSEANMSFVKSIGADKVYDYESIHIIDIVRDCKPDILLDTIGIDEYWDVACQCMSTRTGRFVCTIPPGGSSYQHALDWKSVLNVSLAVSKRKLQHWIGRAPAYSIIITLEPAHLREISEWIEQNQLKISIEHVYNLDQVVQAMERLETGRVVGKLVLKVQQE
ncbi:Reticulon-4-interacting protein 1, mitochondrial [Galdieria sulphuraria]|uniref:NADPH2:quinone reductase isoform 1 n=1 Tax=Galdieria sulphuraria TaxID=130081 RepID=M2Y766_GALSU|nr:NADPH2:quinone reductase isoform 1 [Galdieria sulphuraria]EME31863.1 NADPH2:quinone reductase isoform 1 [Galdieria sulphuraria]GJD10367.1 Reticulon-4-interacting protein 1, mitochondrial [Galdieria sulphuraria]|eukprot:XP_005708383.1 NADPH2:quinone reductase isoform 1 [Galdieria sulphuraria]